MLSDNGHGRQCSEQPDIGILARMINCVILDYSLKSQCMDRAGLMARRFRGVSLFFILSWTGTGLQCNWQKS